MPENGEIMSLEIEILKRSNLFATMEVRVLREISNIMEKRSIKAGESLASAGETARFFFFLISGAVLLSMEDGKSIIMDIPGDFIGFEVLSLKGVYRVGLTALIEGEIFVVDRNAFLDIIRNDADTALDITYAWHKYKEEKIPFADKCQ